VSGYSGTPLAAKLGLKDGQAAAFVGLPPTLTELTGANFRFLETVQTWDRLSGEGLDYLHLFTDRAATLEAALVPLRRRLAPAGMFWVSWPKKAAKLPTDLTEDVIRARALADVLVDVKVCAVDEVWSGLKLVIRKDLRPRE
jgi:hypothetical protein